MLWFFESVFKNESKITIEKKDVEYCFQWLSII